MHPRPAAPPAAPRLLTLGEAARVLVLAVPACPCPWREPRLLAANTDAARLSRPARRLRYLWRRLCRCFDNVPSPQEHL